MKFVGKFGICNGIYGMVCQTGQGKSVVAQTYKNQRKKTADSYIGLNEVTEILESVEQEFQAIGGANALLWTLKLSNEMEYYETGN